MAYSILISTKMLRKDNENLAQSVCLFFLQNLWTIEIHQLRLVSFRSLNGPTETATFFLLLLDRGLIQICTKSLFFLMIYNA